MNELLQKTEAAFRLLFGTHAAKYEHVYATRQGDKLICSFRHKERLKGVKYYLDGDKLMRVT